MGRLHVRVQPGARRTGFVGWYGDLPKLAVAAPPVGGAANEEVVKAVAAAVDVPNRHVRIVGGAAARTKRLEVDGLDDAEILARITDVISAPTR
jgi:uncharacterized protein YggU (UPF0235/DUF167 family)